MRLILFVLLFVPASLHAQSNAAPDGTADRVSGTENVHQRSDFDHARRAFQQRKKGTVAFIGGSITEMEGYRVMVSRSLRERFPDTEFRFVNAGISSTCSTTGAFRLSRDVLAADPDLLFVEFAVNDDQDAAHGVRECLRGMEGILRHARVHDPRMDLVVTHFVNPPMLESLQAGKTPVSIGAHERVAEHYSVSTVNLAREVAQRIDAGRLTWDEYGGTHPAEGGNRIAAEMITDLLSAAWSGPIPARAEGHPLPKPIDSNSYFDGRLLDVAAADREDAWRIERPDWSRLPGAVRSRFSGDRLLCSSTVGAEASLSFEARAIGIYVLAGPDAGFVEYSIDDGPFRRLDLYHRFSKGLHYPRTVLLDADLAPRAHHVTLRVGAERNPRSSGNAIRILQFVVNAKDREAGPGDTGGSSGP